MNNVVKTLDGMDDKIKAAAWRVYDKTIKRMAEVMSEEEYRCELSCAQLTPPDVELRLNSSTNRERINYVFLDLGTRFEDNELCKAVLTEFCESIGLTFDEGYNIYSDVELKGY